MRACVRATGRERVVGSRYDDGGTAEVSYVSGIFGGRYVWMNYSGSYAESADVQMETMTDLRTGKHVDVTVEDEGTSGVEVVAAPGVLVSTAGGGIVANYTDGRKVQLSAGPEASALAVAGSRVYWREKLDARTAVLELPESDPARRGPLMRTLDKCKARKGARLVESDETIHLSRVGASVWACRVGKTRRLGEVTDARIETGRFVSYRREGLVGLFDLVTGERRELEGVGAISGSRLMTAGPSGLRLWPDVSLAPSPVSEPAFGWGAFRGVVYWLDGAQVPHFQVIAS